MTTITKADWANMQRDLSAALKRAEEAEESLALWREEAAIAGELKRKNQKLLESIQKLEKLQEDAQRDLSAALKMTEEAEKSLALRRNEAAIAGELRQENDALRAKLEKAEKRVEAAKQKPARLADNGALVRRLKKRIAVLEGKEPKAKRGGNGDQG